MRFLISVIDSQTGMAAPGEMEAIKAFNQRLRAAGHWIFAGGLAEPAASIVIDNRGGAEAITSGPLLASNEYVAGFWIIDAPDPDAALRLAAEGSKHCNRKVELRAFLPDPD